MHIGPYRAACSSASPRDSFAKNKNDQEVMSAFQKERNREQCSFVADIFSCCCWRLSFVLTLAGGASNCADMSAAPVVSDDIIKSRIAIIVRTGNLEQLTIKTVRAQLEHDFGVGALHCVAAVGGCVAAARGAVGRLALARVRSRSCSSCAVGDSRSKLLCVECASAERTSIEPRFAFEALWREIRSFVVGA